MKIEFDPNKDLSNQARHGVSLSLGEKLMWDEALVWVDNRFGYDELRMIGLVPIESTLYYVAFTERGDKRRLISLRKALRKEVRHYVENYR